MMDLSGRLGVGLTNDLRKYLWIPLLHKRTSRGTFAPILEKTRKKLEKRMLEFSG